MAEADQAAQQFKIVGTLVGHEQDVRAITGLSNGNIATSSRDRNVIVWNRESNVRYNLGPTHSNHTHYVGAVFELAPGACPDHPNGAVVSGSNDKTAIVWEPLSNTVVATLRGHDDAILSVGLSKGTSGDIVTGSMDKTAKVWRNGQAAVTLRGHDFGVWAVIGLVNGTLVTASADKTIKMWDAAGNCTKTMKKHEDAARGLCRHPQDAGFYSCSNDGSVILWSNEGDVLQTMLGHENFVYSLASLPTGEIISASEDRTVRVWNGSTCVQTIAHPSSLWCVSTLPNGDIITGSADSMARIFTRDPDRVDEDMVKAYEEQLASVEIDKRAMGDVDIDTLPGPEALIEAGVKEGQYKMVKNGSKGELYVWSMADAKWAKVGDIVGGEGDGGGKKSLNGVDYDYVFDVDCDDGVMRKLGYNKGDNPWMVAQQFLWTYEMGQDYLQQVADFICQNANVSMSDVGMGNEGAMDPLSGSGETFATLSAAGNGARGAPPSGSNPDPFTATGGGGAGPPAAAAVAQHVPARALSMFEEGKNADKAVAKAQGFSSDFQQAGDAGRAVSAEEWQAVDKLLMSAAGGPVPAEGFKVLIDHTVCGGDSAWPSEKSFPMLDLLRLAVLGSNFSEVCREAGSSPGGVLQGLLSTGKGEGCHKNTRMLALRVMCNCFKHAADSEVMAVLNGPETITWVLECLATGDKNTKVSAGQFCANYVITFSYNEEGCNQILFSLSELLGSETEAPALYRSLIALGTLLSVSSSSKSLAQQLEIVALLKRVVQQAPDANCSQAASQCLALLG